MKVAHLWRKNGDHPDDRVGELVPDPFANSEYERLEGAVVQFFRLPPVDENGDVTASDSGRLVGRQKHSELHVRKWRRPNCDVLMHDHGWIDTPEGGHIVCPGDWIVTNSDGSYSVAVLSNEA